MRPFYAFVLSHCLATYVMLAAVFFVEERGTSGRHPMDAQDALVLILMPLLSWYMLLEALFRFAYTPWHAALVFGSYLPAFFATHYLARLRRLPKFSGPHTCPQCGYDLRATPRRCPECGRAAV